MKKILLKSMFFLSALVFSANLSAQFTESFEGTGTPTGWTVINNGDPNGWEFGAPVVGSAHSGSQVATITFGSTAHDDYLITPQISVTAGLTDQLRFYGKIRSTTFPEEFNIKISTTGTAAADFDVLLDGPITPPDSWEEYVYDLSAYDGQDIYIAFQAISTNEWYLFLDDVTIEKITTCPQPSAFVSTAVNPTDVDVEWTEEGGATEWNIEIGVPGFTPGTGNEIDADNGNTSQASSLTGLSENMFYHAYVQADCGPGDLSNWTGPILIHTDTAAVAIPQTPVSAFPWNEDFESGSSDWNFINGVADNYEANHWVIGSAVSNGGSNSLYVSNDGGVTHAYNIANSSVSFAYRDITMPASYGEATLSFDWFCDGESSWDRMTVWAIPIDSIPEAGTQLSSDGNAPDGVIDLTGQLSEKYAFTNESYVIPTEYAGESFRLVFQWRNDNGFGQSPPAVVDNINITTYNCVPPYDLASSDVGKFDATVAWNDSIQAPSFIVEYGPAGFTPGTGDSVTVQTDTFTVLTNLISDQDYDYYVSGECSDQSFSSPAQGSFTTLVACAVPTGLSVVETSEYSVELTWSVPIGGATDFHIIYGPTGFAPGDGDTIPAPPATVTGLDSDTEYDFYVLADCGPDGPSQLAGPVTATTELACAAPSNLTFSEIGSDSVVVAWDGNGSTSWMIEYDTVGFDIATGGTSVITTDNPDTLYGLDPEYSYDVYIWADCDIAGMSDTLGPIDFTTQPICPAPTNLTFSEIGADSAVVAWDANGTTNWMIEYDTVGFTLGDGMNHPTMDNPDTLYGLNPEYAYDVYIWADCDAGGLSDTLGPVDFMTQPTCMDPSNIVVDIISGSEAEVSWDENGTATEWNIEYGVAPISIGDGTFMHGTTNPDTIAITGDEDYQVYVQARCSSSDSSAWVGPFDFDTKYCEASTTSTIDYISEIQTQGAESNVSYATSSQPAGSYADETAQTFVSYAGQTIDIGVAYVGGAATVKIWIDLNNDNNFDLVGEEVYSNYGPSPHFGSITVPAGTPNGDYRVRVRGQYGSSALEPCGSGTYGSTVDFTLTIDDVPSCFQPTDLTVSEVDDTSAVISWEGNGSSEYVVEWGDTSFVVGTGTSVYTTDTFTVISGLPSASEVDVYVRAICGPSDTSSYAGPATFLTECVSYDALGFCEGFDIDNSPTIGCWRILDANADGDSWAVSTLNPNSGDYSAVINTVFNSGNNDDYLITPALNMTGEESMNFFYRVQSSTEPNNFQVLLSTTGSDVADFTDTLMHLAQYSNEDYMDTTIDLTAYSGKVYIAFHVPPSSLDGYRLYIDDVCFGECIPTPGQDGTVEVCRADETVDLTDGIITNINTSGTWEYPANQSAVMGDTAFNVSALPAGSHEVFYIVQGLCEADTTIATVNVYGPSSAGADGSINVCINDPIDLYSALSGNADLGGDWYDYNDALLPNSLPNAPGLPAQYNYHYITSNGVCPADTALVEVIVVDGGSCGVSVDVETFTDISVYPNPTTSQLNIVNPSNASSLKAEMLDMNGRVVLVENKALANASEATLDIEHLEKGIYTLRVYNNEGQKTFKIVKQ